MTWGHAGGVLLLYIVVRVVMIASRTPRLNRTDSLAQIYVGMVWTTAIFASVAIGFGALVRSWWVLLTLILLVPLVFPWALVQRVCIPRGWVKASYALTRMTTLAWQQDRAGGAAFAAAWALTHQVPPNPEDRRWIEDRVGRQPVLTAAGMAALGLVAATRGASDEARAFLGSVVMFDEGIADDILLKHTLDWLVGDAAARGDWSRVVSVARHHPEVSAQAHLLIGIGQRAIADPAAPSQQALWAQYNQLPPGDRPDRDLLTELQRPAPPPVDPDRATDTTDPLEAALSAHIALVEDPDPDPAHLVRVAQAWDRALDQLSRPLSIRAAELGVRRADPRGAVVQQIEAALAAVVQIHQIPLAELPADGILGRAVAQRREDLLSTIELAAERMQQRIDAEQWLPVADEARAWTRLADLYLAGVAAGGDEVRRLLFRVVYHPLCTLSVELYNHRSQRWLSNAITRWLLREARLAEDSRAIELQERNLRL